jgi:type IV fimbrial biogenesis protein FimT
MEIPTELLIRPKRGSAPAAGFTIIELMVTLTVAGILLAVGIPSFQQIIANNRLTGQANELVAALTLARSQAITTNRAVSFCRATNDIVTICSGAVGDWEFWIVRNAAGAVIRRGDVSTHGGAIVTRSTLTNDQVVFASDGLARTNNVLVAGEQITVCANNSTVDNQRQITLGAGSRVSTVRASGGC